MRHLIISIVFVFLFSCSVKETTTQNVADTINHGEIVADTASFTTVSIRDTTKTSDSVFFIGFANYFATTKEFYVSLYSKTDSAYEHATEKLDSIIYDEDAIVRKRLPIAEAETYFNLQGTDTLLIYTRKHKLIALSTMTRVEHFSDMISGEFVGVYKIARPVNMDDAPWYCISAGFREPLVPQFSSLEVNDNDLDNRIAKRLKSDTLKNWTMQHVRVTPSERIYSIASLENESYLLETAEGKIRILKQVSNDYHFKYILPIPIMVNGKPLMIVSYNVPESDVEGDLLLAYNGNKYEPVDDGRANIGMVSNPILP
jgi:hypothetical protein